MRGSIESIALALAILTTGCFESASANERDRYRRTFNGFPSDAANSSADGGDAAAADTGIHDDAANSSADGGDAANSSADGGDAAAPGDAANSDPQFAQALLLDNVDEYVTVAHTSELAPGGAATSMSAWCWIRVASRTATDVIIAKWSTAAGTARFIIRLNNTSGQIAVVVATNSSGSTFAQSNTSANVIASLNTWYLVLFTYDGTQGTAGNRPKIRVNDTAATLTINSGTMPAAMQTGTEELSFGGRNGGSFLDGYIDDCGYSQYILSAGESTALYNGGTPAFAPSTAAAAFLYETGMNPADSVGTIYDRLTTSVTSNGACATCESGDFVTRP